MRLLIGTTNKGKMTEISEALHDLPLTLLSLADLGINGNPTENGSTFEQNAQLKAHFFHAKSGIPTVADDSGIIVEALQGALGLHTRRWGAGPDASDDVWIDHFLKRMKNEKNRRASFVCSIAYIDPKGSIHAFQGECSGIITPTLEASWLPGLPISACFKPDGFDNVFSALTPAEKNRTSHRGKALQTLRAFLSLSVHAHGTAL